MGHDLRPQVLSLVYVCIGNGSEKRVYNIPSSIISLLVCSVPL